MANSLSNHYKNCQKANKFENKINYFEKITMM